MDRPRGWRRAHGDVRWSGSATKIAWYPIAMGNGQIVSDASSLGYRAYVSHLVIEMARDVGTETVDVLLERAADTRLSFDSALALAELERRARLEA